MKVFVDTNIVLDALLPDRLGAKESEKILDLSIKDDFRIHISSLSIANIAYCSRKIIGKERTKETIKTLSLKWKVLALNSMDIDLALDSKCPDFEDAMQISMAELESDVIVTNDKKHFAPYTCLPVYTPAEFLDKLRAAQAD